MTQTQFTEITITPDMVSEIHEKAKMAAKTYGVKSRLMLEIIGYLFLVVGVPYFLICLLLISWNREEPNGK